MTEVPHRLGLVTVHKLARKIKNILTKYHEVLELVLDDAQMAKVDALIECCNLFITDVPQYPTL